MNVSLPNPLTDENGAGPVSPTVRKRRLSGVDRHLILVMVVFVASSVFFRWIAAGMDAAGARMDAAEAAQHQKANPWGKE